MTAEEIVKTIVSRTNDDPTSMQKIELMETESDGEFTIEFYPKDNKNSGVKIKEIGDKNLKERCYEHLLSTMINKTLFGVYQFLQDKY